MNNNNVKQSDLISVINPRSMFSDAIKSVRTNLQFSAVDKELKMILVTSSEPGNGKSFISANLAVAYAQDGKKVLVIDCDLRRGRQHDIFDVMNPSNAGYSNLILNYKEDIKLSRYITKTPVNNIDLLPTGPIPPNPIELLSSKSNEEVLKEIKDYYDIVILDCPPILGMADTTIMTKFSDEFGYTKRVDLDMTFRFDNQINDVATKFITQNPNQLTLAQIYEISLVAIPADPRSLANPTEEKTNHAALKQEIDAWLKELNRN